MRLRELPGFLETRLTYPVGLTEAVRSIGDVEVEAPDRGDSETVATILGGLGNETYGSSEELFEAIVGNVSDEYIGRKFYDDRGGDPVPGTPALGDDTDRSF